LWFDKFLRGHFCKIVKIRSYLGAAFDGFMLSQLSNVTAFYP